jgi:hypothetical protein
MSSSGTVPRAAVPVSSARAVASRQSGARSRRPKPPRARRAQHRMRSSTVCGRKSRSCCRRSAFAALEAALIEELVPEDALQRIPVGRIAAAAWRLEVEVFAVRGYGGAPASH